MRHTPTEIRLIGEPEFPVILDDKYEDIDLEELDLSPATGRLVAQWMTLVTRRLAEEEDESILVGIRAATSIARDLKFSAKVHLAMLDSSIGGWFSIEVHLPQ